MKTSLKSLEKKLQEDARLGDLNRARSVSIGTAFGGVTELSMRANNGHLWCIMQPVEVIELIHQLAANIGCHIHIQPRRDFAAWRDWKYTEAELAHARGIQHEPGVGHSPFVKGWHENMKTASVLPAPETQPGLQPAMMARSESNEQTVATQKTVGRKRTKRAAAAA
jgi:hypothetical protein